MGLPKERKGERRGRGGGLPNEETEKGWGVPVKTDLPRANEEKAGVGRMRGDYRTKRGGGGRRGGRGDAKADYL